MAEHSIDLVPNLIRGRKSNGRSMYHAEAKRELVRRCLQPGVSLAATAVAHGLNPTCCDQGTPLATRGGDDPGPGGSPRTVAAGARGPRGHNPDPRPDRW